MTDYPNYTIMGFNGSGETCAFVLSDIQDIPGVAAVVKDAVYNAVASFPGIITTHATHSAVVDTDATPTP